MKFKIKKFNAKGIQSNGIWDRRAKEHSENKPVSFSLYKMVIFLWKLSALLEYIIKFPQNFFKLKFSYLILINIFAFS